jgi:hypothetical protein
MLELRFGNTIVREGRTNSVDPAELSQLLYMAMILVHGLQ